MAMEPWRLAMLALVLTAAVARQVPLASLAFLEQAELKPKLIL